MAAMNRTESTTGLCHLDARSAAERACVNTLTAVELREPVETNCYLGIRCTHKGRDDSDLHDARASGHFRA
jgi:hypothetical protein